MKLVIFGATGDTGLYLIDQALTAGHEVTAVARNPQAIIVKHKNLRVVRGDVTNPATLNSVVADQDVVLSALGTRKMSKPITIYSVGMPNIIAAMQNNGVRRLICVTSGGVVDSPGEPFFYKRILKPFFLRNLYDDMQRMETIIKRSKLDWVIVRPGYLFNGPRTGGYRINLTESPYKGWKVSRADVAEFMLKQLTSDQYIHTTPALAY